MKSWNDKTILTPDSTPYVYLYKPLRVGRYPALKERAL